MKSSTSSSSFVRCSNKGMLPPFYLYFLALIIIILFFILYSPNPLKTMFKLGFDQKLVLMRPPNGDELGYEVDKNCDLFQGQWISDTEGPQYTNSSCKTIPVWSNCFRNGRQDREFLYWRWKPDKCDLPRFNPKRFLEFSQGKKLAFVGDSVARNNMDSLLCLLSNVETPREVYKNANDGKQIWYFPNNDFTLIFLWTRFLVSGAERVINGSSSKIFDLHLDKLDQAWTEHILTIDYIIISGGNWFFRVIYLHSGGKVIGCLHCNEPNITAHSVAFALGLAFRAALRHINNCKECRVKVTLLRTFSPSHFEHGAWNTGGHCNRTSPIGETKINLRGNEWELRSVQVKEVENAKKKGQKKFGILDVSKATMMRPDGHPGKFLGYRWHGYNDCLHWCLPGVIDAWNDFLMPVLRKEA